MGEGGLRNSNMIVLGVCGERDTIYSSEKQEVRMLENNGENHVDDGKFGKLEILIDVNIDDESLVLMV